VFVYIYIFIYIYLNILCMSTMRNKIDVRRCVLQLALPYIQERGLPISLWHM